MMNKKFDCVKMTRDIRDKFYEENKEHSLKDFSDKIAKKARNTSLWKNLKADKTVKTGR